MKSNPALAFLAAAALALAPALKADPLKVGDKAPEITGVTEAGAKLNLGDVYKQQPYTLVYFYPKAETKGCTTQGCSLRDGYDRLTKKGVAVIGVSHDSVEAQKAFKENHHFQFTLIADQDEAVSKAFGVPDIRMTALAHRSAYLIHDGKIIYADYKGTTDKQAETILQVLDDGKSS